MKTAQEMIDTFKQQQAYEIDDATALKLVATYCERLADDLTDRLAFVQAIRQAGSRTMSFHTSNKLARTLDEIIKANKE